MGVPAQALEQERQAEEAIKQAQARHNPPPEPEEDLTQQPQEKPEAVIEQPSAEPASDNSDLQAKLDREVQLRKTLEGRLRSQLKPANEEIRKLRKELADLQQELAKSQTENAEPETPGVEKYLSDEEKQELGDVLDVNARMVKGILEQELGAAGIDKVMKMVMTQNEQQKETRQGPAADFWPLVDSYCPGARDLNRSNDVRWLQFLDQYDAETGVLNRQIAEDAFNNDDPIALADLFVECKRQFNISDEAEPAPVRVPKPEKAARHEARPDQAISEPGEWTQAEVRAFYDDVARKRFKGTAEEQAKLEAEIMAAARAGRIKK